MLCRKQHRGPRPVSSGQPQPSGLPGAGVMHWTLCRHDSGTSRSNIVAACQAFSYLWNGERVAMVHTTLVQAAKQMAALCDLNPAEVAGHSFRLGGASFAFQAGVPDILIQLQGWVSTCYREYVVISRGKALQATKAMFDLIIQDGTVGANAVVSEQPAGHVGHITTELTVDGTWQRSAWFLRLVLWEVVRNIVN